MEQGVMETKVIFDCTKPLPPYKFAERARAKPEVVNAIEPDEYLKAWSRQPAIVERVKVSS
jgi:hypothetical protein